MPPMDEHDAGRHDEQDRTPPLAVCAAAHPLLEDVYCQRLRGHPGQHAANAESQSVGVFVRWSDREARAG